MKNTFIRCKEDGAVYRLYFEKGSMTLSKRKCGYLVHDIIEKCIRDGKMYRNDFKICENYVEVYDLIYDTNEVKTILIDKEDWEKYDEYYFSAQIGYVCLSYNKELWRLHRLLMGLPLKVEYSEEYCIVDHLNGNPQDNRKDNLKIVSFQGNSRNLGFFNPNIESGVRGVTLTPDKTQWRVRFGKEYKIKATVFDKLSDAVEYRYIKGEEIGFYFREGSTTIENYINNLKESS